MDPHKDHDKDKDDKKADHDKNVEFSKKVDASKKVEADEKDELTRTEAEGREDHQGSYRPAPGEPKKGPEELRPRTDLPSYKVEKEVHAAKIVEISQPGHNNATELTLEGGASVTVSSDYIARFEPEVGGYYVQDSKGDNYASSEDFGDFRRQ